MKPADVTYLQPEYLPKLQSVCDVYQLPDGRRVAMPCEAPEVPYLWFWHSDCSSIRDPELLHLLINVVELEKFDNPLPDAAVREPAPIFPILTSAIRHATHMKALNWDGFGCENRERSESFLHPKVSDKRSASVSCDLVGSTHFNSGLLSHNGKIGG